jgi:tetratricopeptide (TPR) repeat protein
MAASTPGRGPAAGNLAGLEAVGAADSPGGQAERSTAMTVAGSAAAEAREWRDKALWALDTSDLAAAVAMARKGLAVLRGAAILGGQDEATVLIALAEIEECFGNFGGASDAASRAVRILDQVRPAGAVGDLVMWCQAQERLAGLERQDGQYETAALRLAAVLERASASLGEASHAVVTAASSLGVVHQCAGDLDAAAAAYQRATTALAEMLDPDPLAQAALLRNLGSLARARGDAVAGIPLAEEGVAFRIEVLGPDHPDVARDLNLLGVLYQLARRRDDAARAYGRALTVFESAYGPDHYDVGVTCANLAALRVEQGRCLTGEAYGRRSLRVLRDALGPHHAAVGLTLLHLSAAVAGQGRRAEVRSLAVAAHSILAARLPDGHPHVRAAERMMAEAGRPPRREDEPSPLRREDAPSPPRRQARRFPPRRDRRSAPVRPETMRSPSRQISRRPPR